MNRLTMRIRRRKVVAFALILGVLDDVHPASAGCSGYQLWKETGLRAGRLYPALEVLEKNGIITGTFASDGRRYYKLRETE